MSFASRHGSQLQPDELRPLRDPYDELQLELDHLGTVLRAHTGPCRELDGVDFGERGRIVERVLDWAQAAGLRERAQR